MDVKLIKQSDVPEGMLGSLPWGTPLARWTPAMLRRALEDGHVNDSPKLAAAISEQARKVGV